MPSLDDARDLILALPEVTEGTRYGRHTWFVREKGFAWERPLTKADIKRLGDEPVPGGPILALAVDDLADKAAALEAGHDGVFTIAHFDNYAAILIQLDVVDPDILDEAILDAWLACAPESLARTCWSDAPTDLVWSRTSRPRQYRAATWVLLIGSILLFQPITCFTRRLRLQRRREMRGLLRSRPYPPSSGNRCRVAPSGTRSEWA